MISSRAVGSRRPRGRWRVLALVWLAQAVSAAVVLGIPLLAPHLREDVGLSLPALTAGLAAVTFGAGASVVLWGALADRLGERLVIGVGGLVAAASLGALTAPTSGARGVVLLVVAGVGSASAIAAGGRLVADWFDPHERGLAMGLRQTAMPVGAAASALLLPALTAAGSASAAVGVLAGVCALTAIAASLGLPAPAGQPPSPAGGAPSGDARLRRLLAASLLLGVPQLGLSALLVVFLHDQHGWSVQRAGALLAAVQLLGAAARPVAGRWSDGRAGRLRVLRRLATLQVGALLCLAAAAAATAGGGGPGLTLAVLGAGVATMCWNGVAAVAASELAAPGRTGLVLGWQSTAVFAGGAVGQPLLAVLATQVGWSAALSALCLPAAAAAVLLREPRGLRSGGEVVQVLAGSLNQMSSAISLIDVRAPGQPVLHVNAAFERLTGFAAHEAVGRPWTIVEGPQTDPVTAARLREALATGRELRVRVRHHRRDGQTYWSEVFLSPVRDAADAVSHFLVVQKDVTAQAEAELRAAHMAYHDELTGLPNRAQLLDTLERALQRATRDGTSIAVLFLDLDGFKPANDRYGHDVGDQLLVEVGRRWAACLRADDLLARYGGDEFVVLLLDLPVDDAAAAATDAARRCTAALHRPFPPDADRSEPITLGVSVGVARSPVSGVTSTELLTAADAAMYLAKHQRRAGAAAAAEPASALTPS